jgi:hypothetical protein
MRIEERKKKRNGTNEKKLSRGIERGARGQQTARINSIRNKNTIKYNKNTTQSNTNK